MNDWFIEESGKTLGPISNKQLKELANSSKISEETPLKKGVEGKWSTAGKVKGLFPSATSHIGLSESTLDSQSSVDANSAIPTKTPVSDHSFVVQKSLIGVMFVLLLAMGGAIIWLLLRTQPYHSDNPMLIASAALPAAVGDTNQQEVNVSLDDAKLNALLDKRRELKQRLENEIPTLRNKLALQAEDVKKLLTSASAADRDRLEVELNEIARADLAAESHDKDVRELLNQLDSGARQLDRLRDFAKNDPKGDEKLRQELERMAIDIGTRLSVPLDRRIGNGPIEDLDLKARLNAIVNRKEAPQYVVVVPENSTSIQAYTAPPQGSALGQIEKLLESAKANDNAHNGKVALSALEKILQLNPTNAEARALRLKVMRYYGAVVLVVPLDYASIQQAMDAAQSGDAVMVKPGRYKEAIQLKDGVTLVGEDMATCRLELAGGYDFVVEATGAKTGAIRNLTIDGQQAKLSKTLKYGIGLELKQGTVCVKSVETGAPANVAGLKVGDAIINVDGQKVSTVSQMMSIFVDRKIHDPERALLMEVKSGSEQRVCRVTAGKFRHEGLLDGIIASFSGGIEIDNCMLVGLGAGVTLIECPNETRISNCEIQGNDVGVFADNSVVAITNTTFEQQKRCGAYIVSEMTDASIRLSNFTDNGCGVEILKGANCILNENNMLASAPFEHQQCVAIEGKGTRALLKTNKLRGGMACVVVKDGAHADFHDNTIGPASFCGVEITGEGSDASLIDNTIADDQKEQGMNWGVRVVKGATASIRKNTLKGVDIGVVVDDAGSSVDVSENDFSGAKQAVTWERDSVAKVSFNNKGILKNCVLAPTPTILSDKGRFQVGDVSFRVSIKKSSEGDTEVTFYSESRVSKSIEKLVFVGNDGFLLSPILTGSGSFSQGAGSITVTSAEGQENTSPMGGVPETWNWGYLMKPDQLTVRVGYVTRTEK